MSISDYDTQANTRLTWCLLLDTFRDVMESL